MDNSTICIIGARGQLGKALQSKYPEAICADIQELDITDRSSVVSFDWSKVKIILNAAAYTDVDKAETAEGRVAAWKVNAVATANLVEVALKNDASLVHISSDYVFDGTHDSHTEDEPLSPLSVYGQSKAAGDVVVSLVPKHYLIRTSWVIGDGDNFVRTMLNLAQKGVEPTVVADQVGRLTFTNELVRAIDYLFNNQAPFGTYNITNGGDTVSWADVTREIFKNANYDLAVTDTTTAEYYAGKEFVAPRPLNSTLSLNKIQSIGFEPVDWRIDLAKYIEKELRI
jgi:dTDP-4-dehydrorhamnose 3,5-epimerase